MFRSGALAAGAAAALAAVVATTAAAAPPAPCNNAPQITDATGDGHHTATDVQSAWLSEANGRLQAVIKITASTLAPEHGEAPGAQYAFIYGVGPQARYVRATLPVAGPPVFDQGTYADVGGFTSAGPTAGVVEPGGTVTLDVPGIVAGTKLIGLRVLTWDGPDFVDHAPGGTSPVDSARGAEYIVGSCAPAGQPTPTPGPGDPGVTSVQLAAPARVTGRKTVTVSGKVLPARAGVPVVLSRITARTALSRATTAADGTFKLRVTVGETTRLRAIAGGIGSGEIAITARSKVKVKVRNRADGSAVVTGTVDPRLPGRVLWLRSGAVSPSARTTARNGKFTLRLKSPRPGRYQAVFIPADERAERSTSNTGVIR